MRRGRAIPHAQYVWRTRGDNKVRPSHSANEGKVFSWDAPPRTGHPGEAYNCRCWAEPYVQGRTEFFDHEFISDLNLSDGKEWGIGDFVAHYYFGGGSVRTLVNTGHLRQIAEYYAYHHGAFRRLSDQIAEKARERGSGPFSDDFRHTYDFKPICVRLRKRDSIWPVRGDRGGARRHASPSREDLFQFFDRFADPTGHGIEPGGIPYDIVDNWITSFTAQVFKDPSKSQYGKRSK